MQAKHLIILVFIAAIMASNYLIVLEYQTEYVPDNFDISKMLDQKYRCIRYFNNKVHSKFLHSRCRDYIYDYTEFTLERARYIYMFYMYNLVITSLFLVFNLLLI